LKILKYGLFKAIISEFEPVSQKPAKIHKNLVTLLLPERDEYWNNHYDFGKLSKKKNVLLGMQRIDDIIINVLLPLVYLYSRVFELPDIKNNLFNVYRFLKIKPGNSVLNVMESQLLNRFDIEINTPSVEQGVIQLYNFFCTRQKCRECEIGRNIKDKSGFDYKIIYY
jgi:hypothetical protein